MRKIQKMVCAVLSLCLIFTVGSCGVGDQEKHDATFVYNANAKLTNTTHKIDVKEGNNVLFSGGKSDYTIVYDADEYTGLNVSAVAEMKTLILESTGFRMAVKSDDDEVGSSKIISVGLTKQAQRQSKLMQTYNKTDFNGDGYLIQTIDDSVYMLGKTARGNLNSVYEFLEHQFDFDAISDDVYTLKKNVVNMNLKKFDVLDIPDFQYRTPQLNTADSQFLQRIRAVINDTMFNRVDGNYFVHNVMEILPKEKYQGEHPEWYSTDGEQLCFMARGDEESAKLMSDTLAQELIDRLAKDPSVDYVSISPEDGSGHCKCAACTKDVELFGYDRTAYFANLIPFANRVARKLKVWNQTTCPERDITLFVYSYGMERMPPVKMDANKKPIEDSNGNFMPYSDDLLLDDNIAVVLCGFNNAFYGPGQEDYASTGAADDLITFQGDEEVKRCLAVMKNKQFYFWTYSACFKNYLIPHYSIASRQAYYKYLKNIGGEILYDQCQFNNGATTGFGTMNYYVSAKLMWDVNEDVGALETKFLKNYFQDAYEAMNTLWTNYSAYMYYLAEEYGALSQHNSSVNYANKKCWPLGKINEFLGYIDDALEAIEPLKNSNPEKYQMLYKHIIRESIQFRYLKINLYSDIVDMSVLEEQKTDFLNDCRLVGITRANELTLIDEVWSLSIGE